MEQVFRRALGEAKARGQAVLLAPQILSEVEALCDRVAILRQGTLVEVGALAEMRHLSALTVGASSTGGTPDLTGVPGVRHAVVDWRFLRCQVEGTIEPLLEVLAGAGVSRLLSREPSLEELFLARYGGS